MASMKDIHSALGANVCRRCINRWYRANLEPSDFIYADYPHPCSCCGNVQNIVVDLRNSGKLKMMLKTKNKKAANRPLLRT